MESVDNKGPRQHRGMDSARTSTVAIAPEGGVRSDEVQPQEEPPDGPSRAGGGEGPARAVPYTAAPD